MACDQHTFGLKIKEHCDKFITKKFLWLLESGVCTVHFLERTRGAGAHYITDNWMKPKQCW